MSQVKARSPTVSFLLAIKKKEKNERRRYEKWEN